MEMAIQTIGYLGVIFASLRYGAIESAAFAIRLPLLVLAPLNLHLLRGDEGAGEQRVDPRRTAWAIVASSPAFAAMLFVAVVLLGIQMLVNGRRFGVIQKPHLLLLAVLAAVGIPSVLATIVRF